MQKRFCLSAFAFDHLHNGLVSSSQINWIKGRKKKKTRKDVLGIFFFFFLLFLCVCVFACLLVFAAVVMSSAPHVHLSIKSKEEKKKRQLPLIKRCEEEGGEERSAVIFCQLCTMNSSPSPVCWLCSNYM